MSATLTTPQLLRHRLFKNIPGLKLHHLRIIIDKRFADRIQRCGPYRVIPADLVPEIASVTRDYLRRLAVRGDFPRQPTPV
jgi:hypothetical protein